MRLRVRPWCLQLTVSSRPDIFLEDNGNFDAAVKQALTATSQVASRSGFPWIGQRRRSVNVAYTLA